VSCHQPTLLVARGVPAKACDLRDFGPGTAVGWSLPVRVTTSAAATVTAVTTATEGHAPMRLARGCEPPVAIVTFDPNVNGAVGLALR
jgi:hypothetical protein